MKRSVNTRNVVRSIVWTSLRLGLILGLLGLTSQVQAQNRIAWESDFGQAMQKARESNRLILIHFYGDNCPPCKAMDAGVFTDSYVIGELNRHFVPLKINSSLNSDLFKQFDIKAIPSDVVLRPNGEIVHRRQGGISAEHFSVYLSYVRGELPRIEKNVAPQQVEPVVRAPEYPPAGQNPSPNISNVSAVPRSFGQVEPSRPVPPPAPLLQATPSQAAPSQALASPVPAVAGMGPSPALLAPPPSLPSPFEPTVPTGQATMPPHQGLPNSSIPLTPQVASPQYPPIPVSQTSHSQIPQINYASAPALETKPIDTKLSDTRLDAKPIPERSNPIRIEPTTLMMPTSPSTLPGPTKPVEDSRSAEVAATVELPLGLDGYCPVVLTDQETWVPGNPMYFAMYRGMVYRFSSEEALGKFQRDPNRYAPAAMGEDIVLVVERNKKTFGFRKFGAWFQGRVYLFSSQETLDSFASRPEYYADIALKYETAIKTVFDSVQR